MIKLKDIWHLIENYVDQSLMIMADGMVVANAPKSIIQNAYSDFLELEVTQIDTDDYGLVLHLKE